MIRDLTKGSVLKCLFWFSLPLILANLLQTLYSLVDSVVVGQVVGPAGLAAVSTTADVINFFTMISMGLGAAGQIIISQQVGRKEYGRIRFTIGTLFTVLFVVSMVSMAVLFFAAPWVLRVMQVPEESCRYGYRYLIVCAAGMPLIFGYNAVSCILRGMGDSQKPLVFVAVAAVTNCILDLVFVVWLPFDTLGAALATVLGQGVSFILSLVYLICRKESFGFDFRWRSFWPERESLRLLMKVGIPQALQYAAIMISMLYVCALVNQYGVGAAAVNGVYIKLEGVCRIVVNSLAVAGSAIVGQSIGAGDHQRCIVTTRWVGIIGSLYCAACGAIIYFFPEKVFGLFSSDPEVLNIARDFALVGAVSCLAQAARSTFNPVVNGIGFAALAMISGLIDGVIARISLSLFMGVTLGMGLIGIWWGSCIAGFLPAIINGAYYYSGKWRTYNLFSKRKG